MDVRLEELTKTFSGDVLAVSNVNLEVPSGEFTVFLGPSGCGKTTTLRMIAGLEKPDSGSIFIGDRLVNHLPPKDRNVAMVFQTFALYPSMNVFENIAFPLEVRKMSKTEIEQRVNEVAKLVGIQHLLQRRPSQVSGGEAQRTALARTLVRAPDVLLMDEPLSNLDAKLRVQLRAELKRLHQEVRRTTIYVTHDQEEAMTLGDRIVIMRAGVVQQVGSPREIFFQPRNRFVAGFVGSPSMNMVEGWLREEDGQLRFVSNGFNHPLTARAAEELASKDGDRVLWGIRPDTIGLAHDPAPDNVQGVVDVVELLGTRQLVYIDVHGHDFTVLTESTHMLAAGATVYLHFDPDDVYLFDADSGDSLLSRTVGTDQESAPLRSAVVAR